METLYSFVTLWSSKRLRSTTESPEVLEPTRLIPSAEQRLPLPSSSAEEAGAAQVVVGSTGSSGGGSGLAVPLLQLPTITITPAVAVADTPSGAAAATVTFADLPPSNTGTGGGRPHLEKSTVQQRPLLSPPSTTAEGCEGDAAAAAALMSLRLMSSEGALSLLQ